MNFEDSVAVKSEIGYNHSVTPSPKKNLVSERKKEGTGVLSVTLAQFTSAEMAEGEQSAVSIFDRVVKRVRIVGRVEAIEKDPTCVTYTLNDGTAQAVLKNYGDDTDEGVVVGSVVAAVAEPRSGPRGPALSAVALHTVEERLLACHRIEAIFTQVQMGGDSSPLSPEKLAAPKFEPELAAPKREPVSTPVKRKDLSALVLEFFTERESEERPDGYTAAEVLSALSGITEDALRATLTKMTTEGILYHGDDDEHFLKMP